MARHGRLCQLIHHQTRKSILSGVTLALLLFCMPHWLHAGESIADSASSKQTQFLTLASADSPIRVQADQKMPWSFRIQDLENANISVGSSLSLRYTIHRVDQGHRVMTGRRDVVVGPNHDVESFLIDDLAPHIEGVYEARFQLILKSEQLWARLRPKERLVEELRRPMLVLSAPPVESSANPSSNPVRSLAHDSFDHWQTIGVIRPSDAAWAVGQWLPDSAARLIPGVNHVSGDLQKGNVDGQSVSILKPNSVFQARLPVMVPGYGHRITIRCPREKEGLLRFDVGEGTDQSQATTSGVIPIQPRNSLSPQNAESDQWVTRTFFHYPRKGDQIWLSNLSESESVSFESVTVSAGPTVASSLADRKTNTAKTGRMIVLSIDDPNWVTSMTTDWRPAGDSKSCNEKSISCHRTWMAAHRVLEQATRMGANAVSISINDATDQQLVAIEVFDRHDIQVIMAIRVSGDPPVSPRVGPLGKTDRAIGELKNESRSIVSRRIENRIVEISKALSSAPSFAGVMVKLDGIPTNNASTAALDGVKVFTDDFESNWQRVGAGKKLILQSSDARSRMPVAKLPANAMHVVSVDVSNPSRSMKEPATDKTEQSRVVRMVDRELLRQNPSKYLFQTIERFDPAVIIVPSKSVSCVFDKQLAKTGNAFTNFPYPTASRLLPADPRDSTARVQHAVSKGSTFLAISNLAPWSNRISIGSVPGAGMAKVTSQESMAWDLVGADAPNRFSDVQMNQGILIPARQTFVLRYSGTTNPGLSKRLSQRRWTSSVDGGAPVIAEIKRQVTEIVERLGMLSDPAKYDRLVNGSFETVGEMGLVGWLHAQYPMDCVAVDTNHSIDGKQSVRLTTDRSNATKTWLVSDIIKLPSNGRLAVSMALRAEKFSGEKTHQLRVSVEGTQAGDPMRQSANVDVPVTGEWQSRRIVLEVADASLKDLESLRLTIDSMSSGSVWIDDVRLHQDFATSRERTELQNQAYLAVEGLQRGDLTPSARLLTNHWAGRLMSSRHSSLKTASVPPADASMMPEKHEQTPEIADRSRGWFFDRLRF